MAWQEVDIPRGVYVGWGSRAGQHVTGAVLDYDPVGATEPPKPGQMVGAVCPLLEIELTAPASSFDRDMNRTDFEAGQVVCLSVSQKQLQRGVKKASLAIGDLVKIELQGTEKTANGTVKIFGIMVDRGGAVKNGNDPIAASAKPAGGFGGGDDEPPF